MDIKSLRLFQHLANSLHFGQTASACHVSPSTLSRAIQRLEDELNCELLQRDNRSVLLTPAGEKLLGFSNQTLEQLDGLKNSLNLTQEALSGTLNIFCSVTAAYSHLPKLLDKFRRAHPQVDINLDTGDAADAYDQVSSQKVDLAIAAQQDNVAQNIYFQSMAKIPLNIIAPAMDCAVTERLKGVNIDWANIPVILPEHGTVRKRFDNWYRQKQLGKPNVYAQVSGHEALVSMVALGCGVGIAPQVVLDNSPVKERINVLSEYNLEPFSLGLCCLKKRLNNPLIEAFVSLALKH